MPHTFFIYNGRGSSPESVKDLEVLCGSVQERSNIYCTDFLNSPDGLSSSSIIVIPGGSAMTISFGIGRSRWDVTDMVKTKGYGYFGVCAGAYIATNEGYFYNHIKTPECPTVFLKTQGELSLNLGDYAITHGPFLPDEHAITMGNYNAH